MANNMDAIKGFVVMAVLFLIPIGFIGTGIFEKDTITRCILLSLGCLTSLIPVWLTVDVVKAHRRK